MDTEAQTANRLNELPEETREFLSQLRQNDIDTLKDAMRFYETVQTLGRVAKWGAITVLAIIVGVVSLYENVLKVWGWFHR
ncbi:hypothetical protein R5W60_04295 [Brucella pseudintermedia]|uniref:hypothetical protein n=1 Tax=Brucella pseudintermedia TaxID=370111 RepID=UPI003672157D|nr:hypothetical protein R5W60_04295 [Brucella pseudintermedia]